MLNMKTINQRNKGLEKTFSFISKMMKLPWFSSGKSSEKETTPMQKNEKKEIKKSYKISSLPENLQRIALLIQQTDKEIKYLNKKLDVNMTAKKELEKQLSMKLNTIKE